MNVESPTGHPIEVFEVGGHQYIAVANTRDSSVEIFDTDETADVRRLARIRVGLEPVSVRFNENLQALFTANFLGDSVSRIGVSGDNGPTSFSAKLELTKAVTDEPIDIAFYGKDDAGASRQTLFVTHMALDGFGWLDAQTLDPVNTGLELSAAVVTSGVALDMALKEPRTVLVNGDELVVLALKGGANNLSPFGADFDYYCDDLTSPLAAPTFGGNVGTSGLNMVFDAGGDLYVVGAEALNEELEDESNVKDAPTGFVKSMFYRIESPCSNPVIQRRDVNLDPGDPLPDAKPVAKTNALSMLLDLAVFETGGTPKVFFAAAGNDRIGVIEPDPTAVDPLAWPLRRIDIPTVAGNPLAGPSGLAMKLANPSQVNDPGARLYSLNHLDASVSTIDPISETLVAGAHLTLSNDPRPDYLTVGQQFLYDSKLSGTGFVSCASCHVFARTDRLDWDLGAPELGEIPIPVLLPDAIPDEKFPADKQRMITQSLQGLLNFEVPRSDQFWVTNAPYHWRGDRASFLDFNGAFDSLLGGAELEEPQMRQFEEFINTIHYPPNPKQARDRRPLGDFGIGEDIQTDGSTGSMRGLKIFHTAITVGAQRSCATSCHMGFEGSNNLLTEGVVLNEEGEIVSQPVETAALRGLFQKEARRDVDGTSNPLLSPLSGFFEGLTHTGFTPGNVNNTASINFFNNFFFEGRLCDANGNQVIDPGEEFCSDLQMVNEYVHQFDWGVAPIVGCVQTVDITNVAQAYPGGPSTSCAGACGDLLSSLDCMEEQANEANTAISVHATLDGVERGFYYEPRDGSYVEEPWTGASFSSRIALLDEVNEREQLVFQAVPLGDERRVAAPSGVAKDLPAGTRPSEISLLPMVPNTMHTRIPDLTLTWANVNNVGLESRGLHFTRLFQWGLIQDAATENGFGLGTGLRHDPSRRFRVSGENFQTGAVLALAYPNDPGGPPDPSGPFGETAFGLLTIPIYATDELDARGMPIWESAIQFEKEFYYGLMLGGPFAPNVAAAWLDQRPFTFPMQDPMLDRPFSNAFDPLLWNWYKAFVFNPDLNSGEGPWERLTIE